jgi:hypothetical protein
MLLVEFLGRGKDEHPDADRILILHTIGVRVHQGFVLRPFVIRLFCFKDPFQFTPLLNLRSLIFGLTPVCWFISIYLSIFYCWEYFYLRPLFQERN